jgi:hypothetical protein
MLRGLQGRRIALFARGDDGELRRTLEGAGADVHDLALADVAEEDWHSGKYAALVIGTCEDAGIVHPKALQLLKEFLVADKPVAVFGQGLRALDQAGAVRSDAILAEPRGGPEFAQRLVRTFADRLDEAQVDEMSDESFPASDPPAVSPSSAGPAPEARE